MRNGLKQIQGFNLRMTKNCLDKQGNYIAVRLYLKKFSQNVEFRIFHKIDKLPL